MNRIWRKRLKNMITLLCFFIYSLNCSAVYASGLVNLNAIQEMICKDGVRIARPKPDDERVYNLLKDNGIHGPKEYAQWLEAHIKYRKDPKGDRWSRPIDVLNKKYGDCEDFTLLNIVALRVMGYKPIFLAFYTKSAGHAICVFKHGGSLYYFDNMELKRIKEPNILEFARNQSVEKKYVEIKQLDLDTRKWNLIYKNG